MSETLRRLREARPAMQAEREALPPDSLYRPSRMWLDFERFLRFIVDLSDENLRNIRLHTGFMTGVLWFGYFASERFTTDGEKLRTYPHIQQYERLVEGVPARFQGTEPVTTPECERIGVRYKGKLISEDLIRYQRCLSNLYWSGVFDMLERAVERPLIVEIGAGYGGLAHQIARGLAGRCAYVIFDLPETLYWSTAFLAVNNPGARIFVYRPGQLPPGELPRVCAEHDFVMLPNYLFDRLLELPAVHLAVNLLSFQEMSDAQVAHYVAGLSARVTGALYSENFGRHPYSTELRTAIDEHLGRAFTLTPEPAMLRQLYPDANSWVNPDLEWQLFPYVGTPHGRTSPLRAVGPAFFTPDRRLQLG